MKAIFTFLSLISGGKLAGATSDLSAKAYAQAMIDAQEAQCEEALGVDFDRTGNAIYFNGYNLPEGVRGDHLIEDLAANMIHRGPVVVFDTNWHETWLELNVLQPFTIENEATYRTMSPKVRHHYFLNFLRKAYATLQDNWKIMVFDHHFAWPVLADASTTPLVVDFLNFLNALPASIERDTVRRAIATGVRLRDHSDADIVLANLAASWAENPSRLSLYGTRMKNIAYFNDHATLDADLTAREKFETILGYNLLVAFEKWIPASGHGAFDKALALIPRGLDVVTEVAADIPEDAANPGANLVERLKQDGMRAEFGPLIPYLEARGRRDADFKRTMDEIMTDGRIERRGAAVVVRFPLTDDLPSGLDVLRYVSAVESEVTEGAKYVVLVGREFEIDEYWHVKFRAMAPGASLTPLVSAVKAEPRFGGGGRATAGGLYGRSGRRATNVAELEADLDWVLSFLRE